MYEENEPQKVRGESVDTRFGVDVVDQVVKAL